MVFGQAVCLVLKLKWIVVLLVMEAKAMDLYALTFSPPQTRTQKGFTRDFDGNAGKGRFG